MRKSLIIIASALVLGVAASHRLRYDSTVFADAGGLTASGPRATQVEYPPCVPGVREDRCIQLYERGMRRSYQRWLAAHGRAGAPATARAYPVCRSRSDDNCRQVARATVHRGHRARRAAIRHATRPAQVRQAAAPAPVRQVRVHRQQVRPVRPAAAHPPVPPRRTPPVSTPGI